MSQSCTNDLLARIMDLFGLAICATLIYLFLEIPPFADWYKWYIPDREYRLLGKAMLFFVLFYFVDRLTLPLRAGIVICDLPALDIQ